MGIKAEAFGLLTASGELKPSQIKSVADFVREAAQSPSYFNAVVNSSGVLPISTVILKSLKDTLATLQNSDNQEMKRGAATLVTEYVTRNISKLELQRSEIDQIREAIKSLNLGDEALSDTLNDLAEAATYTWSVSILEEQVESRKGKGTLTQKNIPFRDASGHESGYLLSDLQLTQQTDSGGAEITVTSSTKKDFVAKFTIKFVATEDAILFKGDVNPQFPTYRVALRKDDRGAAVLLKEEKVN